MLVVKVVFNVLLGVLLQGLAPMKITRPLMARYRDFRIAATVDDQNHISIGLSTTSHESLELLQRYAMPRHVMIEILLENDLRIFVLRLKITTYNSNDTLIYSIVNIIGYDGLIGNTLDMIRNDLGMLKISSGLHPPN